MKKLLLFSLAISIGFFSFSQERINIKTSPVKLEHRKAIKDISKFENPYNPYVRTTEFSPVETQMGDTQYDLQTNASTQNRIYLYDDGTIGAVWTMGFDPSGFALRGTGHNFYNGTDWGPWPTVRIDDEKTGWPSYVPWGPDGEIVVNHTMLDGLGIFKRTNKFEGEWIKTVLAGPPGKEDLSWPRMVTNGENNEIIHTISTTYSEYQNLDFALLYARSDDGGETWNPENLILDDMTSDEYLGFGGDDYDFAEPAGNAIAFIVGSYMHDLFLMKSTDDGDTWEQTIIWEHPYPFFDFTTTITDTFYCVDNSITVALDNEGMAHVAFGITRILNDELSTSFWHFPGVDGIGYWNETMPAFEGINGLDPDVLAETGNLIGWTQDVNGNGTIDFLPDGIHVYRSLGLSTMPCLSIDGENNIFLAYSSTTETYDNTEKNYKHIWVRSSPDNGLNWGPFYDLNSHPLHFLDECLYADISPTSDENIHILYQTDYIPGLALDGDHSYVDNIMYHAALPKGDLVAVPENNKTFTQENVSQNYPNPFNNTSIVIVRLEKVSQLSLEVFNLTGQKVYETNNGKVQSGSHTITIDASNLSSGVYFYTVFVGDDKITKKMIVN
ncbi:MAG: T9SS type A sorting domain-containing protein [Bacteroidetes bacterium]|nr:T9SS type A sorting domain-containing protein [Bacteroidota bacterium]